MKGRKLPFDSKRMVYGRFKTPDENRFNLITFAG